MERKQAFHSSRETPNLSILPRQGLRFHFGRYQTQGLLLALENQYSRGKCWLEGKVALIRKADNLGRRRTHVPKTNSKDSARP